MTFRKDDFAAVLGRGWMELEWLWINQEDTVVQVREAGSLDEEGSSCDGEKRQELRTVQMDDL